MNRLDGKTAIVTGGSRGIGEAIATAFAHEGARVVIASRKAGPLAETAERINDACPDSTFSKACHVGRPDMVRELVDWTTEEVGVPDVLINNAGTNPHFGPMLDCEMGAFDKTFEVNLKGYFYATREVVAKLREAGRPGSIVNVSSVYGLHAAPLQGVYGMTKAAVISMTQTLAHELGPDEIRVNAICPGLVDTRLAKMIVETEQFERIFTDRAALGRYAQPEEMAGLAVYLASDESSYATGEKFILDGGYLPG